MVFSAISTELGLKALRAAPLDAHLLILQRIVRLVAYGQSTLVLAAFLHDLGFSDFQMGLFMTLTLVGDIAASAVLTIFADRWGRRKVLLVGSLLMSMSGAVFALSSNYWVLLAAATAGVISPSGNEIGPFKAIEESTLAQLTPPEDRSTIFAWYAVLSGIAAALGSLSSGWMTQYLQEIKGQSATQSYRYVFILYTVCGLIKTGFSIVLSSKCEPAPKPSKSSPTERSRLLDAEEQEEVDPVAPREEVKKQPSLVDRILGLSPETRKKVYTLSTLFGLDNLASGLVPLSFTIYYFTTRFHLDEGTLGNTFFTTSLIAALSNFVAASLSRRLGNIKTMAFTHLPSSTFLALIPLPSNFHAARALLIARFCTAQMDGAPRTAFLASYIPENERTSVMGIINVVKTLCQSIGPSVTGYLAGQGWIRFSFFAAGGMKISYDLMILYFFTKVAMAS
ncbi:major facilitator superfamily domain-containing protein [Papiliotrema laurentii]|uniref:Major facilitator superfamily domain-containing protein n=1 Tax=Papiliotrema laurentii TaxID=5418 RepID=A0AAD9FV86_PAPLA|nr:major facilitator superfamily domain-containing protein [Papiliotrema laurentii]